MNDNLKGVPFPQADNIYKLMKIVDSFSGKNHLETFKNIDLDLSQRQYKYYLDAAIYLDLLDKAGSATELGVSIFSSDKKTLFKSMVVQILTKKIFFDFYKLNDSNKTIFFLTKEYKLSKSTAKRRFITVKTWVNWCRIILKENNLESVEEIN